MGNQFDRIPSFTETGGGVTGVTSSQRIMGVLGNQNTSHTLPIGVKILGARRFSGVRVLDRYSKLPIPRVKSYSPASRTISF